MPEVAGAEPASATTKVIFTMTDYELANILPKEVYSRIRERHCVICKSEFDLDRARKFKIVDWWETEAFCSDDGEHHVLCFAWSDPKHTSLAEEQIIIDDDSFEHTITIQYLAGKYTHTRIVSKKLDCDNYSYDPDIKPIELNLYEAVFDTVTMSKKQLLSRLKTVLVWQ
jgi:hypothetical protein